MVRFESRLRAHRRRIRGLIGPAVLGVVVVLLVVLVTHTGTSAVGSATGVADPGPVPVQPSADGPSAGAASTQDAGPTSPSATAGDQASPTVEAPSPVPSATDAVPDAGSASIPLEENTESSGPEYAGAAMLDQTVTVSSNAGSAWAVADGSLAAGDAGGTWTASSGDTQPAITLSWPAPRRIASVLVLGLVQSVFQANWHAGAPLKGTLVFADGLRMPVPGISGNVADATVLAFPARTTTSVTLVLERNLTAAGLGLRAFAAYGEGVTPPRWGGTTGLTYSVSAPVASTCPDTSGSAAAIVLVCPATGTKVGNMATVVLRASGRVGAEVVGRAWVPASSGGGSVQVVTRGTVEAAGTVSLQFSTTSLLHGPLGLQFRFASDGMRRGAPQLNVQLYNDSGVAAQDDGHAPAGTTLVWDEEFTSPLSTSVWGNGSTYAATKPAYWGPSEFGEAVFADPTWGLNTLSTLEGDYLRIQAQPANGRADPAGWGRDHVSGMMSSQRVGGSGFSAQYGYFEARVLAPGGTGSWPAFWMLDGLSSAQKNVAQQAEVDAFELYGHDTLASCHTIHNWPGGGTGSPTCLWPNGFSDWSLSWHDYGVQIRPGGADFYIDGVKVASRSGLLNTDRAFFFMLNLSLGGGYPVQVDAAGNTLDMYVDWVRVSV